MENNKPLNPFRMFGMNEFMAPEGKGLQKADS
jgi:hypothetical protein